MLKTHYGTRLNILIASTALAMMATCVADETARPALGASARRAVERSNAMADEDCRRVIARWEAYVNRQGSSYAFKKWAKTVGAWDTRSGDSVEESFHRNICDEADLAGKLQAACGDFQRQLIRESTELAAQLDATNMTMASCWSACEIDSGHWDQSFTRVYLSARKYAKEGRVHPGVRKAGSFATTLAICNGLHAAGMCGSMCGAWPLAVGSFMLGWVVDACLEEATDPTDRYATELRKEFVAARDDLLNGRRGFKVTMNRICRHHQQLRLKLLAP